MNLPIYNPNSHDLVGVYPFILGILPHWMGSKGQLIVFTLGLELLVVQWGP